MADDLVTRLQNWKGENWVNEPDCAIGICKEAADRIEELERAVLDLVQYVSRADLAFYTKTETRLVFRKLMEKQDD
jgi:hypothetical protein